MKNNIWFIVACVLVFCVGYNLNDSAVSFQKYRVAVVDVSQLLSHSPDVQELKRIQDKETEELNTLISKAQNEILNTTDKDVVLKKEAEYRQQIESKRSSMEKQYASKLEEVNKKIRKIISAEAQKENYNLVLPVGMVISGGEDITENVVKTMK
ncbi:OmpH family outer membrane protein [bacterium]|nr:OmpH family outer membrane protein [bacterium]